MTISQITRTMPCRNNESNKIIYILLPWFLFLDVCFLKDPWHSHEEGKINIFWFRNDEYSTFLLSHFVLNINPCSFFLNNVPLRLSWVKRRISGIVAPWADTDARHSWGRKRLALPPHQPREILKWAWAEKDAESESLVQTKQYCMFEGLWCGPESPALSALNLRGHIFMISSTLTSLTHTCHMRLLSLKCEQYLLQVVYFFYRTSILIEIIRIIYIYGSPLMQFVHDCILLLYYSW